MRIENTYCLISHQWIGDHYYPDFPETDIPHTERKLSPDFPICLVPHSGGLFSIVFDFNKASKMPKHNMTIHVQTSKIFCFVLFCFCFFF